MEEGMSFTMRELTDAEKDEFLKNNFWGILCFGGDEPYGIPLGYEYGNGNVILGLSHTGRKMECVKRSRKVCLTICTPTSLSPNPREAYPFTSVIIDGELEEIAEANRDSYGYLQKTLIISIIFISVHSLVISFTVAFLCIHIRAITSAVRPAPIIDVIHQVICSYPGKEIRKPPMTRSTRAHKASLPNFIR